MHTSGSGTIRVEMSRRAIGITSLVFVALALVPAGAHVAELPNKIGLPRAEYQTVQQIYRGWALFGIVIAGALVSTLALTITTRRVPHAFRRALIALLCLAAAQTIFWTFTFPTNVATENWTVLPPNWIELRARWEYSHAVAAGFTAIAFLSLTLALVDGGEAPRRRPPDAFG
jgi:hypothetical protein